MTEHRHAAAGERLVAALTAKDPAAIVATFTDDVDFRAMTPGRFWEASSHEELSSMLGTWFEADDEFRAVTDIETVTVGDRGRVSYRARLRNPRGDFVLEQTAYFDLDADGERIALARVACSGFRPLA